jgi:hypothetical protein
MAMAPSNAGEGKRHDRHHHHEDVGQRRDLRRRDLALHAGSGNIAARPVQRPDWRHLPKKLRKLVDRRQHNTRESAFFHLVLVAQAGDGLLLLAGLQAFKSLADAGRLRRRMHRDADQQNAPKSAGAEENQGDIHTITLRCRKSCK